MHLRDIALNNLRRRKLKVFLIILGLAFGVTTVVTLMTITGAMRANLESQFDNLGAKVIVKPKGDKVSFSYGSVVIASGVAYDVKKLTTEALDIIKQENNENVSVIAPKLLGTTTIEGTSTMIVGIDFEQELKLEPYWSVQGEVPKAEQELLIGAKVARVLKLTVGSPLRLFNTDFIVSGVLEETANEEDGLVFMQLSILQKLINEPQGLTFIEIMLTDSEAVRVDSVVKDLKGKLPDASVTPVREAVEGRKQLVDRFTSFSIIISLVVTLIGALIILSTMMSSVNERTREIGIFRAIGFRQSHIVKIILIEAAFVSLLGGILGYVIGITLATYVGPIVTNINLVIAWNPITMLMFIFSTFAIGLLASVHPAIKASRLEPTEALRFM